MEGIDKLIEKWQFDYELWKRSLENPLFHTKEQMLRASQSCLVISSILGDLKELKDKITKKN